MIPTGRAGPPRHDVARLARPPDLAERRVVPAGHPARLLRATGGLRARTRLLLREVRRRMRCRDVALVAAGLTFYAGIAVVPLLVLAFALTAQVASPQTVRVLGARFAELLPSELGAPTALQRLVEAGLQLDLWGGVLALVPMTFYGEGLRRALLSLSDEQDRLTAWRGRLLALPLLLVTPVLLFPLLLVAQQIDELTRTGGAGSVLAGLVIGFYTVLAVLALPLAWGFRVVAPTRLRWTAVIGGALFTAACLSGFLQGFVVFLALPIDLGAPFGGLTAVGGTVAIGLWLFALHVVVVLGWLLTQSLDERWSRRSEERVGLSPRRRSRPGRRPARRRRAGRPTRPTPGGGR